MLQEQRAQNTLANRKKQMKRDSQSEEATGESTCENTKIRQAREVSSHSKGTKRETYSDTEIKPIDDEHSLPEENRGRNW